MTERWVKTGPNWMWATAVGEAQVIYVCFCDTLLDKRGDWRVVRKVAGSADPCGSQIGVNPNLATAQTLAEHDAEQLQANGF